MTRSVTLRPRARLDLLEQFVYFGEQTSAELGERYFAAVENTCLQLVNHPRSGPEYKTRNTRLDGVRRFPVSGFDRHVIFYLPRPGGIEVIRVLHGARDIDQLFAEEEATSPG